MLMPDEALEKILSAVKIMGTENLPLQSSQNRVLAAKTISKRDIPMMASSAMDGYALRAADAAKLPAKLKVLGVIPAGSGITGLKINEGECYRIMTGAYVPQGADTVIEWELTDNGTNYVTVNAHSSTNNIRPAKDDIAAGTILDYTGRRISPFLMSRLASVGELFVDVYRKPRIAVIATGSEITPPGGYTATNKLFDANSPAVIGLLAAEQAECSYLGVVDDDEDALIDILRRAADFDMTVITGGISTGDFDYMAKSADKAGVEWLFHKIYQKPGKPLAFGFINGKPIFSVPGNPVSCMFCTYFYVVPAVRRMSGIKSATHHYVNAVLGEDTSRKEGRIQFDRVKLKLIDGVYHAYPYKTQNSNVIGSMAESNAFMRLESFSGTLKKGEQIKVYIFNPEL